MIRSVDGKPRTTRPPENLTAQELQSISNSAHKVSRHVRRGRVRSIRLEATRNGVTYTFMRSRNPSGVRDAFSAPMLVTMKSGNRTAHPEESNWAVGTTANKSTTYSAHHQTLEEAYDYVRQAR